ncbi:nucleolin 1-like isoform X2 [Portunus trituberculatus]|uniref:nucleolin 1-like isoform X2 n=1 Tax=Portunus trituberculatus TaxID=210409 RepID=UPI001E1D15E4|nr:nucleolin 1-like isoform X2 [Portunus trituberculatus]
MIGKRKIGLNLTRREFESGGSHNIDHSLVGELPLLQCHITQCHGPLYPLRYRHKSSKLWKTMAKVKVVKVEETGKDVGTKASDKKNKNEKKILKVISKRNGTDNASVPKKKKRNRGKKNKSNTNGIEASPETKNGESSPTIDEENSEPTNDISSSSVEKPMKEEPATTTSETPEAATKTTESGESEGPNTEGKKKRKRKNKRKASEALEGASESTDNKEDGSEDTAEGAKGIKRMKVEEEKDDAEEEKPKKKTKKMKAEKKGEDDAEGQSASKEKKQQQEKKYVLFMGNLPFELTEEEVREHFKIVADNIVRVTLLNRKKSGKSKGYGFIELKDADSYNKSLKLNNSQLKNRKIHVQFTTPGKKTKARKALIKNKTKKLLGQKKGKKIKKEGGRKH